MAKITISFTGQVGDIPTYEFTKKEIQKNYFTLIQGNLENTKDKVFVCFQSWEEVECENEYPTIFISKDLFDVCFHFKNYIKRINDRDINYHFFCFETYEEAFKYCIDLKDGTE